MSEHDTRKQGSEQESSAATPDPASQSEPVSDVSRRRLLTALAGGTAAVAAIAAVGGTKPAFDAQDVKKRIMARIHNELKEHDYLNDPLGYDKSTHSKYVTS